MEKKLTDEEIVKGLENWILHDCTAKPEDLVNALDLIHRLQDDNDWFRKRWYKCRDIANSYIRGTANFTKDLKELEEEIERLTEERKNMEAEIVATEEARLRAREDAVKELYSYLDEYWFDTPMKKDIREYIKKRYGVEVEHETIE